MEKQTCPRRMNLYENKDRWETNRWKKGIFFWRRSYVKWPGSWYPRTCSYCGGIHPEDVLRLRQEGWSFEFTDKRYKLYCHPSGWPETYANPPVKVYLQHFTDDQFAALKEGR